MAEGWLRKFASHDVGIYSAGIETHGLNPRAVRVMGEAGIDISAHTSNHINEYRDVEFTHIITVCDHAREHCPYVPSGAEKVHHSFPDPAKATGTEEQILDEFRRVRDLIRDYCRQFATERLGAS